MKSFGVLLFFIHACCIQNVFSQCTSRAAVTSDLGFNSPTGPRGIAAPGYAYDGLGGWGGIAPALGAPCGYPAGYADFSYPAVDWAYPEIIASYGGIGEGNVAVVGDLPVVGSTLVIGQVPIIGAVSFDGALPASGIVTITGQCACGCGLPYIY